MERVVGIDWATEKRNRALVILEVEHDGRSTVAEVSRGPSDAEIVECCRDPSNVVVGVDIPFGWPASFASFLTEWTPTAATVVPPRDEFRFRATDHVVRSEVPKEPLSVAADRIALGAHRWVSLVSEHGLGASVDVVGQLTPKRPTLIEVYPGATVVILGGEREQGEESYKKSAEVRRRLLRDVALVGGCDLNGREDVLVAEGNRSDEADAFFAALTAAIYLNHSRERACPSGHRIRRPRRDEVELARREGWIFFPTSSAGGAA